MANIEKDNKNPITSNNSPKVPQKRKTRGKQQARINNEMKTRSLRVCVCVCLDSMTNYSQDC